MNQVPFALAGGAPGRYGFHTKRGSLRDAALACGLSRYALYRRVRSGSTMREAMSVPRGEWRYRDDSSKPVTTSILDAVLNGCGTYREIVPYVQNRAPGTVPHVVSCTLTSLISSGRLSKVKRDKMFVYSIAGEL